MKKLLIVSVGVLALAGCKREGPTDTNSVNIVADNAFENMMIDETAPVDNAVNVANAVEPPAPPPSVDELQQTQEDADATGMTARTDRQASSDQSDDVAPVEEQ